MRELRVAVVGATGAVGREILKVLEARRFPLKELRLYASPRSAGVRLPFMGEEIPVEPLPEGPLGVDLVLASAGGALSKAKAPIWAEGGALVVDNSSAFRYEPWVPLVVPEVNREKIFTHRGLIANPNCTTAILAMALWPLHRAFRARRVIVATYQAASGAGAKGMEELRHEAHRFLHGEAPKAEVFPHPLPFNVIPQIDAFQENGYTREEMKVVWETHKIFGDSSIRISATAVRVPTLRAHAEAVSVEFAEPVTPEAAREVLKSAPGVELVDEPEERRYPMPLTASGKWEVEVGRVRKSLAFENGLDFFVVGDQLLKGAALNAVQIAEEWLRGP
ncbi:aspartate-semialdehyde dehydrogenase [Thermus sediminis]|uniref:aspartate-semialdehyde dehydrogenase n=1 Tax=Thermus sediminis TaxID=1761908 RepID=UPI000E3C2857|nr:aspartate-semialdehyde dehydrogenase [Thermus sediminis]